MNWTSTVKVILVFIWDEFNKYCTVVNKENSLVDMEPVVQVKPVFGHICFHQQSLFSLLVEQWFYKLEKRNNGLQ